MQIKIVEQSHLILSDITGHKILKFIESIGRVCYKSEHKTVPMSYFPFVKMLIEKGHESVLEHVSITVKFITDRGVTHELVRHRLASFSQESTRYCNYAGKDMEFIKPVDFEQDQYAEGFGDITYLLDAARFYNYNIESRNLTPQQARYYLPNGLKTEIVVTANLREWRHILKVRTDKSAHPQMRALMQGLLKDLQEKIPIVFDDINGTVERPHICKCAVEGECVEPKEFFDNEEENEKPEYDENDLEDWDDEL